LTGNNKLSFYSEFEFIWFVTQPVRKFTIWNTSIIPWTFTY